jgi:hypothetical protein
VAETPFLTELMFLDGEGSNLLGDVFSTGGVSGGNEQLGEDEATWGNPGDGNPEFPGLGLRVDVVIENGFLVEVLLVGRNLGEGCTELLEDFAVELLTLFSFEETSEGPGEAVNEEVLEVFLGEGLNAMELGESGVKKRKHLSHTDNSGDGHDVDKALGE